MIRTSPLHQENLFFCCRYVEGLCCPTLLTTHQTSCWSPFHLQGFHHQTGPPPSTALWFRLWEVNMGNERGRSSGSGSEPGTSSSSLEEDEVGLHVLDLSVPVTPTQVHPKTKRWSLDSTSPVNLFADLLSIKNNNFLTFIFRFPCRSFRNGSITSTATIPNARLNFIGL